MKLIAKFMWAAFGLFILSELGCGAPGFVNLPPAEPGKADYRLAGDVDEQSSEILDMLARADGSPVLIEIDSPGGVADEGILIYKILRTAKSPSVCLVNGRAASAAFLILQGCTRRVMTSTSYLFTHEPAIVFSEGASLNPALLAMATATLQKTADAMADLLAGRLGMGVSAYKKRVSGEGWYMNAGEAIDANAIDVVVDGTRSPL